MPARSPRARRSTEARLAKRPARPLHVFLIALGLLIAQGPMLLHLLLVAHTTCEHGELIELGAHAPKAPAAPLAKGAAQTESPAFVADHTHGRGHAHCNALAVRHRVAELPPCVAGASVLWIEPQAVDGERGETRSVPLLALAPKSSPPV